LWATSFLVQAAGVCASCGCSADQSRPALPLPTAQKRSTKYLLFSLERCLGTRRGRSRNSSLRLCQELESRHGREDVQHQESRARTDSTREKTLVGHTRDNNGGTFRWSLPELQCGRLHNSVALFTSTAIAAKYQLPKQAVRPFRFTGSKSRRKPVELLRPSLCQTHNERPGRPRGKAIPRSHPRVRQGAH